MSENILNNAPEKVGHSDELLAAEALQRREDHFARVQRVKEIAAKVEEVLISMDANWREVQEVFNALGGRTAELVELTTVKDMKEAYDAIHRPTSDAGSTDDSGTTGSPSEGEPPNNGGNPAASS